MFAPNASSSRSPVNEAFEFAWGEIPGVVADIEFRSVKSRLLKAWRNAVRHRMTNHTHAHRHSRPLAIALDIGLMLLVGDGKRVSAIAARATKNTIGHISGIRCCFD